MVNPAENGESSLLVVSPTFNESEGIAEFFAELKSALGHGVINRRLQVVLVDDGSTDETCRRAVDAARAAGLSLELVKLSRNFGQQAAIHAGLEHAFRISRPDSLFLIIDSDLQHPPQLIERMLPEIEKGFDHVQMLRDDDSALPAFKRITSAAFYRVLSALSGVAMEPGSSDFRLFNRTFLDSYLRYQEVNRFNRALFASLGFRTKKLSYAPAQRRSGTTKYSLWRMIRLGLLGIIQFTNAPLILCSLGTFLLSLIVCAVYGVIEISKSLRGVPFAVGWPTLIFFVFFWGGMISFNQFVSSLYIASIYQEVKRRPVFIVESVISTSEQSS